ncbi:MAG: class I fructose-bisphosphate aldolase [Actinomycetales bacterium]
MSDANDAQYRMRRLFNPNSGRCLDIAVDHGFFGEGAFLAGIEDLSYAVRTLVDAAPDAIQLTVGQAPLLQTLGGRERPALVMRTDVANVYGSPLPDHMFSLMTPNPALRGVQLDASCIVVNLFDLPDRPQVREACLRNVLVAREDCDRYGMPLMVEPLVMKESPSGPYTVNGDVSRIVPLVRQAVELGADIIKADPTDNPDDYVDVVRTATGVPVLVRGGGKVPDAELLERTAGVLRSGARGIVYGRNIIQHPKPAAMTRALMAMLHENATPAQALQIIADA